jgi:hypothetical protein
MASVNFFLKCKRINEEYEALMQQHRGCSNAFIYRTYIYPRYIISERTFYRMLKIDYETELRKRGKWEE